MYLPRTMPLAHLRTDVAPWRDATLAAIDASLASEGSLPLDLPWERFALQRDGDHFTAAGLDAFAEALAPTLRAACGGGVTRVHVVSDSTLRGKGGERRCSATPHARRGRKTSGIRLLK